MPQSSPMNFLSHASQNVITDPRKGRAILTQLLAESDSHLLAVQQIHRQMTTICQTAEEADFLDAQNAHISRVLDTSKNYMRGIIAGERDPLKYANSPH